MPLLLIWRRWFIAVLLFFASVRRGQRVSHQEKLLVFKGDKIEEFQRLCCCVTTFTTFWCSFRMTRTLFSVLRADTGSAVSLGVLGRDGAPCGRYRLLQPPREQPPSPLPSLLSTRTAPSCFFFFYFLSIIIIIFSVVCRFPFLHRHKLKTHRRKVSRIEEKRVAS